MKKKKILTFLILLLLSAASFAQESVIRGTVVDHGTGEPLMGVAALVAGTSLGAIADFDGKFEIRTAAGAYDLHISYLGYSNLTIQEVKVSAGQVTVLDNIRMQENVEQLVEVVITAGALKTTEEALLTVKRKSANLLDGISSANFRKIGDSDAASAIKWVP